MRFGPVVALLLVAFGLASDIKIDKGIVVLNTSNFDVALTKYPVLAVDFYADWCSHCIQLAPRWEELAKDLSNAKSNIALAKVDGHFNQELVTKYGVIYSSYP